MSGAHQKRQLQYNLNFVDTKFRKMFSISKRSSLALSRHLKNLYRFSTSPNPAEQSPKDKSDSSRKNVIHYRHIYPEFLPDPKIEFRNRLREKLERSDMITRRTVVDIPEFYVGSILSVTSSDAHTPKKFHNFVGICINREGCGLRATFILRNVIDHQGIEILYEMYDPSIKSVEVLKLEKRLDDKLFYLRDALPEYSTFDSNMEAEILPEGAPIPVNETKVKLKPRPWLERWERQNLKGVQDLELPQRFYDLAAERAKPWEKYDLMKQYMKTIPEEEQVEIFSELQTHFHKSGVAQKTRRRRTFVKPTKLA